MIYRLLYQDHLWENAGYTLTDRVDVEADSIEEAITIATALGYDVEGADPDVEPYEIQEHDRVPIHKNLRLKHYIPPPQPGTPEWTALHTNKAKVSSIPPNSMKATVIQEPTAAVAGQTPPKAKATRKKNSAASTKKSNRG